MTVRGRAVGSGSGRGPGTVRFADRLQLVLAGVGVILFLSGIGFALADDTVGGGSPTLADGEGFSEPESFPELSLTSVERLDDGVVLSYDVQ